MAKKSPTIPRSSSPSPRVAKTKRRYAIVGTGSRAAMFRTAITETFKHQSELVALCDVNPLRAANWSKALPGKKPAIYEPGDFGRMIKMHGVDTVVVTSVDRTHHRYIVAALRAGCDVITEKPMTTDAEKCREILQAQQETGGRVHVTFNYRYAPRNSRVKEVLMDGMIGEVKSVHFEWMLDTQHGADYFRRWHRDKTNSGGLLVHKSTHHFDLVNWWLDTVPSDVCVFGGLQFYGKVNQEHHGFGGRYPFSTGNPNAKNDPFALHLDTNEAMQSLYLEPAKVDGYRRDQNVFGDGISIEDDLAVLVRYRNRATMSYHLTAYSPWEGYRVMFNGTRGRLEYQVSERSYVSAADDDHNFNTNVLGGAEVEIEEPTSLILRPHWEKPQHLEIPEVSAGGHGGADALMLADIFGGSTKSTDPLGRAANQVAGTWSILTGIAGNQSIAENRIVKISEFGLEPYLR
jgi:predicted dehydrogenase